MKYYSAMKMNKQIYIYKLQYGSPYDYDAECLKLCTTDCMFHSYGIFEMANSIGVSYRLVVV